jgi:hypothetical protein
MWMGEHLFQDWWRSIAKDASVTVADMLKGRGKKVPPELVIEMYEGVADRIEWGLRKMLEVNETLRLKQEERARAEEEAAKRKPRWEAGASLTPETVS